MSKQNYEKKKKKILVDETVDDEEEEMWMSCENMRKHWRLIVAENHWS